MKRYDISTRICQKNPNAVQNNKTKLFIFCLHYETTSKIIYFKHICYTRYSPIIENRKRHFDFNINIRTHYREKGLEKGGVYH